MEAETILGNFGQKHYGIDDPIWVTYKLFLDDGESIEDVAEDVYIEEFKLREWLQSVGLPRPSTRTAIPDRPKEKGYSSLFNYFRERGSESFSQMADELDTNPSNIRSYYDRFIEFVNYDPTADSRDHWSLPEMA
jgi:hypothetical protein